MKKKFSDISLFRQMATIIGLFTISVILIFTFFIRDNIQGFIDSQCMDIIHRSQQTMIDNIKNNKTGHSELTFDSNVLHFVYVRKQLNKTYGTANVSDDIYQKMAEIVNQSAESWSEGMINGETSGYYYRFDTIDKNTTIISIINVSYGQNIQTELTDGLLANWVAIISLMFILMIAWVSTIISPLQQIKSYLDKVRKGDNKATLVIRRSDEIGELANSLVSMQKEIKNQEETKTEMIHNISHDLKTPIAIIKSYAESIKDGIYPYDTLEKSVDVIIENSDRLEKKVHSLLLLNRLDYQMAQEKETDKSTEMYGLIRDVIQSMKMIRQDIAIERYLDKSVVFKGEEESWRIVVSNLLDNALRYAETKVVIDLQPYSLTVYNDGANIPEDRMAKLFKPFEKGDKGKFGLGLSICYKVCNSYGFNIEVENMPNGVIFIITSKQIDSRRGKLFDKQTRKKS